MLKITSAIFSIITLIALTSMIPFYEGIPNSETPQLPEISFDYEVDLPDYINGNSNSFSTITNEGATLGRVLFYDKKLSNDNSLSCASCHKQEFSFADNKALSLGISKTHTSRNALTITDLAWVTNDGLFWDRRQVDLKKVVLEPILNPTELGANMGDLIKELKGTDYYQDLFSNAFGSTEITEEKIADALAQFIQSIASFESKFDKGLRNDFDDFTKGELNGLVLFQSNCGDCHLGSMGANNMRKAINPKKANHPKKAVNGNGSSYSMRSGFTNGLDSEPTDLGMGGWTNEPNYVGVFKAPHLRNIELTKPYMHDGRFETLEEVVDFYSDGLQSHPNSHYTVFENDKKGLNFSAEEKKDLIDFLKTLSDTNYLTDEKWSDPFVSN
ncbi:MAG: cytochrome-c peroxidase [Saprospiraceae bacterium]